MVKCATWLFREASASRSNVCRSSRRVVLMFNLFLGGRIRKGGTSNSQLSLSAQHFLSPHCLLHISPITRNPHPTVFILADNLAVGE